MPVLFAEGWGWFSEGGWFAWWGWVGARGVGGGVRGGGIVRVFGPCYKILNARARSRAHAGGLNLLEVVQYVEQLRAELEALVEEVSEALIEHAKLAPPSDGNARWLEVIRCARRIRARGIRQARNYVAHSKQFKAWRGRRSG